MKGRIVVGVLVVLASLVLVAGQIQLGRVDREISAAEVPVLTVPPVRTPKPTFTPRPPTPTPDLELAELILSYVEGRIGTDRDPLIMIDTGQGPIWVKSSNVKGILFKGRRFFYHLAHQSFDPIVLAEMGLIEMPRIGIWGIIKEDGRLILSNQNEEETIPNLTGFDILIYTILDPKLFPQPQWL